MQKIEARSPETESANIVVGKMSQLELLFPEVVTDHKIDFDVLREILTGSIEERDERYGLNWPGKRRARQAALTSSTGTLRPAKNQSLDWDDTNNIVIEGDNLEVLKLLQKCYHGQIKMIYIDPPYNTGNDFIYPDDYAETLSTYLAYTGQVDGEGKKFSTNTEASGRFHSKWLSMMYPRLFLARNLLTPDGLIFVSISDHEVGPLRLLMNEIFGEENFSAQLVWKSRKYPDSRAKTGVSTDHEYILVYSRTDQGVLRGIERDESKFSNPDKDPRGLWMSRSMLGLATKAQRPNLHYDIVDPQTKLSYPPAPDSGWRYAQDRMNQLIKDNAILWPASPDGRPREKKFRSDLQSEFVAFPSIIDDVFTSDGTAEIRELFGSEVFDFPKPTELISRLVKQGTSNSDDIVLDFFAGSATTGHAVMKLNAEDEGKRRFILVQLPEAIEEKEFSNIVDVTKERLKRARKKIQDKSPLFAGDMGFRVFKLDSSNIKAWEPNRDDLAKSLLDSIEHLKNDRDEADILFELLLKLGLGLTVPIEQKTIGGKTVYSVGAGVLYVCLADKVAANDVEALALGIVQWRKENDTAGATTCVFRDSAFANDIVKTNLTAILVQHGFDNIRSL